jgi:hypothetical protein
MYFLSSGFGGFGHAHALISSNCCTIATKAASNARRYQYRKPCATTYYKYTASALRTPRSWDFQDVGCCTHAQCTVCVGTSTSRTPVCGHQEVTENVVLAGLRGFLAFPLCSWFLFGNANGAPLVPFVHNPLRPLCSPQLSRGVSVSVV